MEEAKRFLSFVVGAVSWVSLLVLIWGLLMNWFPEATWIEQVAAGVAFASSAW